MNDAHHIQEELEEERKISSVIHIVLFCVVISLFGILFFILPQEKISDDEKAVDSLEQKTSKIQSILTPYLITNMDYFDTDFSDEDEDREFFKLMQKTIISQNLSRNSVSNSKSIEDLVHLQKIFEGKVKEKCIKMQKELLKIHVSEGRHFGIPFLFIVANIFILICNEILRGESQVSIIGVDQ